MHKSIDNSYEIKKAKRIWRRYVVAFCLIAAFLLGSHVVSTYALNSGTNEAALINDSGRQRMLSQRILYLALELRDNPTLETYHLMDEAVDMFATAHDNLAAHAGVPEALRAIYFEPDRFGMTLHDLSLDYVACARVLLNGEPEGFDAALAMMQTYGPNSLLTRLDSAVTAFEDKAEARAATLRMIQEYSLFAALLTLAAEALFIFWPAHKTLGRALRHLETAKRTLETQNSRLSEMGMIAEHKANHDGLTGLLNRRGLDGVLKSVTEQDQSSDGKLALLHIDLDRFKHINDTLGHAAGDHILCAVADRLRAQTGPTDFIARVGGDEFVVLITSPATEEVLSDTAQQLINELSRPVGYKDAVCRFGASIGIDIGIARLVAQQGNADQMLVNADIALYRAKSDGRGRFAFYTPELHQRISDNQQLSDEIVTGLSDGQFVPFYQVQVSAETHEIIGLEALARWKHPTQGILAPAHFLDAAASLNVLSKIDERIMEVAARDINSWRSLGLTPPRVAVNLSAQRLADTQFWPSILTLDLSTSDIAFEITESVQLDDPTDQAVTNVLRLKAAGFAIEIDDFGTGHASLLSVQTILPKRVKVAREIIDPIVGSLAQREVVRGICAIASAYGSQVVAEGVETQAHADIATQLGCDVLQGYHFNKPCSADDIAEMLAEAGLVGDIAVVIDDRMVG